MTASFNERLSCAAVIGKTQLKTGDSAKITIELKFVFSCLPRDD